MRNKNNKSKISSFTYKFADVEHEEDKMMIMMELKRKTNKEGEKKKMEHSQEFCVYACGVYSNRIILCSASLHHRHSS